MNLINKKTIFNIFLLLFVLFATTNEVEAVKLGGKLINGPRNILYTVNGGASAYTYNINNGANNWMYTGYDNPIYMSPVSSSYGSTVDFYTYKDNSTTIAKTYFFDSNNKRQSYVYNYLWNQIHFNDKYKYDDSINHDAVAAHELGHVLGLDENNSNINSIMCQTGSGRRVNRPQKVDSEEVVSLYGRY